jgi:hypothetical protein
MEEYKIRFTHDELLAISEDVGHAHNTIHGLFTRWRKERISVLDKITRHLTTVEADSESDGEVCSVCGDTGEIPTPDGYAICRECNPIGPTKDARHS